jgi:hypothetical protein
VTEVGLSGPTKLLVSRENELGLRGSPRGGPSEGRAGSQRDQCKSSDKCLHHISPYLWTTVRDFPATEKTDAFALYSPRKQARRIPEGNRSAPRSDQLYLWIYWIQWRIVEHLFRERQRRYYGGITLQVPLRLAAKRLPFRQLICPTRASLVRVWPGSVASQRQQRKAKPKY